MLKLQNTLRPYPWGSPTAIAELLGREPSGGPEAELWIGAHPSSPSQLLAHEGPSVPLDEALRRDPESMLGPDSRAAFGDRLPFLAKILAAGAPLSIQVHPSLDQARTGYAREESQGPAREAANRNYKDPNHKPEMLYALSDFEALCGFRAPEDAAELFTAVDSALRAAGTPAQPLLADILLALAGEDLGGEDLGGGVPDGERLRRAFVLLLDGGGPVADLVRTAVRALEAHPPAGTTGRLGPALATVVELNRLYPGDPGVLVSLLLHRVSLRPGEVMYLPSGNVHAYLRGTGIEVMASSDNVLRGGLTGKHVDVPELLRTVEFLPRPAPILAAEFTGLGQEIYRPPFAEFQLQRLQLGSDPRARPDAQSGTAPGLGNPGTARDDTAGDSMAGDSMALAQHGPLLVLVTSGAVVLDSPTGNMALARGESAFIGATEAPVIAFLAAGVARATAFAVTLPGNGGALDRTTAAAARVDRVNE